MPEVEGFGMPAGYYEMMMEKLANDELATPNIFGALDDGRREKKAMMCGDKLRMNPRMAAQHVDTRGDDIEKGPLFKKVQRNQLRKITVESNDPGFKPIETTTNFANFGLYFRILENLLDRKFETPTAIQAHTIPHILKTDRDILARADTGSGKTAAFLLPIIHQVRQWKLERNMHKAINTNAPYAIIFTPSKELALQIYHDILSFTKKTGVRSCLAIGELNMLDSIRMLNNGCDIIIGTQGRVAHYFFGIDNAGTMTHLKFDNLRVLVLDEVDRVLKDPNYYTMLRKFTKKFEEHQKNRRIIMFSATLDLENLEQFLRPNHVRIICGQESMPQETIIQRFAKVEFKRIIDEGRDYGYIGKPDYLLKVLNNFCDSHHRKNNIRFDGKYKRVPKTIIYVNRKRLCDALAIRLIAEGYRAKPINGDWPMQYRVDTVKGLKIDEIDIIVATDLASRGLNIPNVERVINYDLPTKDYNEYIHRVGRCGRLGHVGLAISFVDTAVDKEIAVFLRCLLRDVRQPIPDYINVAADNYELFNDVGPGPFH